MPELTLLDWLSLLWTLYRVYKGKETAAKLEALHGLTTETVDQAKAAKTPKEKQDVAVSIVANMFTAFTGR